MNERGRDLRRLLRSHITDLQNEADPRLMGRRGYPSTSDIQARVDELERELASLEARQAGANAHSELFMDDGSIRRVQRNLHFAREQLVTCHERDALPGCKICLGTGWRPRNYFDSPERTFTCDCPEGKANQERIDAIEAELRRKLIDETIYAFREAETTPRRLEHCDLSTFPASTAAARHVIAAVRERLARDDPPWLWFTGPPGVGKSGLAKGAAEELLSRGTVADAVFLPVPDLLLRLRATYQSKSREHEFEVLAEYRDVPLLILDDFGAERAKDKDWAGERLFLLINHRYDELLPTIITSNLTPQQLSDHLGTQGSRIVWRMLEAAEHQVLSMVGLPNLRERKPRPQLEVVNG